MPSLPNYPHSAAAVIRSIEDHVLPAANYGPVEMIDGMAAYLWKLAERDPDPARSQRYRAAAAKVNDAMISLRGPDCICANDLRGNREDEMDGLR